MKIITKSFVVVEWKINANSYIIQGLAWLMLHYHFYEKTFGDFLQFIFASIKSPVSQNSHQSSSGALSIRCRRSRPFLRGIKKLSWLSSDKIRVCGNWKISFERYKCESNIFIYKRVNGLMIWYYKSAS